MDSNLVELASRRNAGIEVRLLWNRRRKRAILALSDEKSGTSFELAVSNKDAMDAFRHPLAYAQQYAPLRALAV
jgi:hypothetical protein